ncbi:MAG TPA: hypothetical protein VGP06_07850 [Janthinobacterium sp.]|jgi:hypothetical protein|nr:hypothetical protein [Janthinobacterium sp.]
MKNLIAVISLAALGGCAVPGPAYYTMAAPQPVGDPHEWHVVSSQPAQAQAYPAQQAQQYTSAAPVYSSPVYVQDPYYAASPVYVQQPYYYYPPVSIGLDLGFGFGGWCCGHRGGGWGRGGGYHHR